MNTATQTQQNVALVNPKIELRNIKTFRGSDGIGLNATLLLNGKKIAFVLDEGCGGEMRFSQLGNTVEEMCKNAELIQALEAYAKTLPKEKVEGITGLSEEDMWMQPDLSFLVDKMVDEEEQKKFLKKMEKKMITAICIGVPKSGTYRYFQYKMELSKIPLEHLQRAVNDKVLPSLKDGEVILNTNLKTLGVKY